MWWDFRAGQGLSSCVLPAQNTQTCFQTQPGVSFSMAGEACAVAASEAAALSNHAAKQALPGNTGAPLPLSGLAGWA